MGELEAIDPALCALGEEGDPRLGARVRAGPVRAREEGEAAGATVALIGVADDREAAGGSAGSGAAAGPRELRRWLYQLTPGGGGELASLRLFDPGDATPGPARGRSVEEVQALAEEAVRAALAAGARVVLLGGGGASRASHAGLLRALPSSARAAAIHVGARCGAGPSRALRERFGERYARVEFGVQMQGCARADVDWAHAQGWPVLELRRLREDGVERRFVRQLTRARGSSEALAVTLELDGVEMAAAPGVAAPSPDGFTPGELLTFARDAGRESSVRVLDLLGCAPALDPDGRTARLGAAAIWSFLAGACEAT